MEEPTVILSLEDIAEVTEIMNNTFPDNEKPSQGFLEWCLMNAIRQYKKVDFFEYSRELDKSIPD